VKPVLNSFVDIVWQNAKNKNTSLNAFNSADCEKLEQTHDEQTVRIDKPV
jgi:hypothetical protein